VTLIDISPLISPRLAVFPGDEPFRREETLRLRCGDSVDLSYIRTTLHLGAHVDAPGHYVRGGAGIDACDLNRYYGPCQVLHTPVRGRILPGDVAVPVTSQRVLFRTDSYPDAERWDGGFAALSAPLVHWLADQGVVLVGIDTPSVDPADDKILEAHQALAARDVSNIEGLALGHVAAGSYTLIALPLKIEGADGSPVRAVLGL
jgi:arylformamidase